MEKKEFAERFKLAVAHAGVEDTQEALGRLLEVSSVMIWSYKTGEKMPRMNTAMRIARKLGVSVSWLLSGDGDMQANQGPIGRILERAGHDKNGRRPGMVPLISSVQAGDWCEAIDNYPAGEADEWVSVPTKHSQHAYALTVKGDSMNPKLHDGEIVVVDPDREAESGSIVVAKKVASQEVTLKQLMLDGGESYLKALNPDWPEPIIRMTEEWRICGRVICKMELF